MAVGYLLFFGSLMVLFYTYIGYGCLIFLINQFKRKPAVNQDDPFFPAVTLIIPAYNEGDWLVQKIENCLQLQYPKELLTIIFITDGSTDRSNEIIAAYPGVQCLFQQERKGKMAAINRSMAFVTSPIVVFSDANSLLNKDALVHIVKHYASENVGGVAGEKKIFTTQTAAGIGFSEGLYWKYESKLKKIDSDFNTVVGAAGELFSIRTTLYQPQKEDIILDDFVLSMKVCIDGYKIVYEPNAFAVEAPSVNIAEERKRRVRIAAGAFQTIPLLWQYLLVFKKPLLYFQYFSRRILRWVFCPACLLVLYVSNAWILIHSDQSSFFILFFVVQNLFYLVALLGAIWYKAGVSLSLFFIPFYFVFMNTLLVEGFIKFIRGKQTVLWEKSRRRMIPLQVGSYK